MKQIRKVCSFILVLVLVFSAFSMSYADDQPVVLTDIYESANAQAISVCSNLGIVNGNPDGTYLPGKSVTRAEFAAMITRALAIPESALQGYNNSKFKDTTGYGWAVPYLTFCESKGIMLGDGEGNAMPGKTITLNEAITMALRAVGYTANSALLTGTWPANYISVAQNNDLYKDVASDATVNRENAAQIIYNTLSVQKVTVASDGETTLLKDSSGEARTMLNTGLGCTMEEGVVDLTNYPDSMINLVNYLGAYGDIYLNKDGKVVAVNPTSTYFSGYVSADGTSIESDQDGKKYYFNHAEFTSPTSVVIENSVETGILNASTIASNAGLSVTLYVDIKGDNITKIYSMTIWRCDDYFEVDSGIVDEIAEDKTINGWKLPLTDDGQIDYNVLGMFGIASLADLKAGNNVYLYKNDSTDDELNYIEVGTDKVSGEVTEYDDSGKHKDKYTVNDKIIETYKGGPYLEVGSTYDIYLDAYGAIFDFKKTSGAADTYGVVKAATAATSFDNYKVKLYTSDGSTKTLNFAEEDPAEIEWTTTGGLTIGAVTAGGLIGYSLDSKGQIDAVDNTYMTSSSIVFKSSKVLGDYGIDPDAVVFTYNGTMSNTDSYDVVKLSDIDAGTNVATAASPAAFILNSDGDVAALFIEDDFAVAADNAVYGVINGRTTTSNSDGEKVFKFTGYIDGKAFTYKTDDNTGFDGFTNKFGIYAITLDTSGQITEIGALDLDGMDAHGNTCSYLLNVSDTAEVITGLTYDNTVISVGSEKYTIADDAIVYKYDPDDKIYTASKLSSIDEGDTISLYDTKGKDADGIATVVIFIAE